MRILLFSCALWLAVPVFAGLERDIEYSRPGDVPLLMDAWTPDSEGPHPAAVLVHGGAWLSGDKTRHVAPLFRTLEEAGFAWFSINYRLGWESLPSAADDVQSAIRYLKRNAKRLGIDPARLVLIGESAGAHLAALAATRATPETGVAAVVSFYGPLDLVALARTSTLIPEGIRSKLRDTIAGDLIGMWLEMFSPMSQVHAGMPPFLLIHGTADTVVPYEQSQRMCDRMKSVGAGCELIALKGADHSMRGWDRQPEYAHYKRSMVDWLARTVRPAQPSSTEVTIKPSSR